jgi:hypothetical protein
MISEDSPFASRPLDRQAFNLGFSLIDSIAWKSAKVTEKFEKWVKVSFDQLLFPHDTLGFGLVLGYFALADAVECYDDKITHLVGLAFINDESFVAEGWTAKTMLEKSSALHYNGANKPWLEPAPLCGEDGTVDLMSNPTSPLQIWQAACIHSKMCNCRNVAAPPSKPDQAKLLHSLDAAGPAKGDEVPENPPKGSAPVGLDATMSASKTGSSSVRRRQEECNEYTPCPSTSPSTAPSTSPSTSPSISPSTSPSTSKSSKASTKIRRTKAPHAKKVSSASRNV